jgi:hypothetical protein
MARGWESKSVEGQQEAEAARELEKPGKTRLTRDQMATARQIASLRLSLTRIAEQLGHSLDPRHREMLERAKADLEEKIETLHSARASHQTG